MTAQIYVEKDCTFIHEGKGFTSGGAFQSPLYLIGYLGKDGALTNWHGKIMGSYKITHSWPINSFLSDCMCQVRATVNGQVYTGRSLGIGMLFRGHAIAKR